MFCSLSAYSHKLTDREGGLPTSVKKMHRNMVKAIAEHQQIICKAVEKRIAELEGHDPEMVGWLKEEARIFLNPEVAVPSFEELLNPKSREPMQFSMTECAYQGKRETMEDAHFYVETDEMVLAGVFDGHGGNEVADYASEQYQKRFPDALLKAEGDVRIAFQALIDEIQSEIEERKDWDGQGSTAVICYIDKRTHLIYTATLGDSEATLYREEEEGIKAIPLSCIRDWHCQKDAKRAAKAWDKPKVEEIWMSAAPKTLYFPSPYLGGVNVSRAFGNKSRSTFNGKPGVIHKSKITVNRLQPNDTLILACDGVKDFTFELAIAWDIESLQPGENLAEKIGRTAFEGESSDNVTVIAIHTSNVSKADALPPIF